MTNEQLILDLANSNMSESDILAAIQKERIKQAQIRKQKEEEARKKAEKEEAITDARDNLILAIEDYLKELLDLNIRQEDEDFIEEQILILEKELVKAGDFIQQMKDLEKEAKKVKPATAPNKEIFKTPDEIINDFLKELNLR